MKLIKKAIVIFGVVIVVIVAGMFSINIVYDKLLENMSFDVDNLEENINYDIAEENSESIIIDNEKSMEHKNEEKVLTIIEVKELEKEISTIDKVKIINIIKSKFSIDEIKDLISLAEDGVEHDEVSYIKDIIKEKLSSEDITKFKEIYEKYQ